MIEKEVAIKEIADKFNNAEQVVLEHPTLSDIRKYCSDYGTIFVPKEFVNIRIQRSYILDSFYGLPVVMWKERNGNPLYELADELSGSYGDYLENEVIEYVEGVD